MLSAMVLLPAVAISLRLRGFKQTQNSLCRFVLEESNLPEPDETDIVKARVVAKMVAVASGHGVYHATCLKQALVLWWMLARRRIKSEIIFGVQKESVNNFNAHAWVECNEVNLSDSEEVQLKFASFIRNRLSTED